MDISAAASQWSSGCESGWTRYLEQSSLSENQFHRVNGGTDDYGGKELARVEEKEEDLSLVSDASSGPSHYHEDDEDCFHHDNGGHFYSSSPSQLAAKTKQKKKAAKERGRNRRHSDLDDTATYPALKFPLQASL